MKAARIAAPPKAAPAGVKAYYAGAVRILVDGVPTRVARPPSRNMLSLMAEPNDYNHHGGYCPFTGRPNSGYAACQCGACAGSPIILPPRALAKLKRAVREASA